MKFKQFTKEQMRLSPVKNTLPRDYPQPNGFPNTASSNTSTPWPQCSRMIFPLAWWSWYKHLFTHWKHGSDSKPAPLMGSHKALPLCHLSFANSSSEFCMFYIYNTCLKIFPLLTLRRHWRGIYIGFIPHPKAWDQKCFNFKTRATCTVRHWRESPSLNTKSILISAHFTVKPAGNSVFIFSMSVFAVVIVLSRGLSL